MLRIFFLLFRKIELGSHKISGRRISVVTKRRNIFNYSVMTCRKFPDILKIYRHRRRVAQNDISGSSLCTRLNMRSQHYAFHCKYHIHGHLIPVTVFLILQRVRPAIHICAVAVIYKVDHELAVPYDLNSHLDFVIVVIGKADIRSLFELIVRRAGCRSNYHPQQNESSGKLFHYHLLFHFPTPF